MPGPTLRELINQGVLSVGTELSNSGRDAGDRVAKGTIQDGGIEVLGRVYATPSGAARAVTGTRAENGWRWWHIKDSGEALSAVRDRA